MFAEYGLCPRAQRRIGKDILAGESAAARTKLHNSGTRTKFSPNADGFNHRELEPLALLFGAPADSLGYAINRLLNSPEFDGTHAWSTRAETEMRSQCFGDQKSYDIADSIYRKSLVIGEI
jgi:hypothetical protein